METESDSRSSCNDDYGYNKSPSPPKTLKGYLDILRVGQDITKQKDVIRKGMQGLIFLS